MFNKIKSHLNGIISASKLTKEFSFAFKIKYAFFLQFKLYKQYINLVYTYLKETFKNDILVINSLVKEEDFFSTDNPKNVFVCWWQGYDEMPLICKKCFNQLKNNLGNRYQLILITSDNYYKYVEIPEPILRKFTNGKIPITQFSDILRQGLIYQNGGIWIDSTIWTNKAVCDYIQYLGSFWSIKLDAVHNKKSYGQLISECQWSSFVIGGQKGSSIFKAMFFLMCKYYELHDAPIDYFLQNFMFRLLFNEVPLFSKCLENIRPSNKEVYSLKEKLNKPFDSVSYKAMNSNTSFFKLNYKDKWKVSDHGQTTYYGHIIGLNTNEKGS